MAVKPPTRQQLAKFLPDEETIRAFESLFKVAAPSTLSDLEGVSIESGSANSMANNDKTGSVIDWIKFNIANFFRANNTLGLDPTFGDLQFINSNSVSNLLGFDVFTHVINNTASIIPKGTVIGFNGASSGVIQGIPMVSNGTLPSLYVIGIAAEDLSVGSIGHVKTNGYLTSIDTTGTAVSETWVTGDILYPSPSTAGALTKVKPTAPNISVPIATVLTVNSTTGSLFIRATIEQQFSYGTFSDTTTKTAAAINTAYAITYDTTQISNGISRGSPTSRIAVTTSGLYSFDFSVQATSTSASTKNLWFWPRKNGTDIANSSMKCSISANAFNSVFSRSVTISLNAGDYIECMWATDDTTVSLSANASTAFAPATPSVVLKVFQIEQ